MTEKGAGMLVSGNIGPSCWGGNSSVGRASDYKARRNTDAGSSLRFGNGFFSSESQLPMQTVAVSAVQTPRVQFACINICAHVNNPKH